MKNDKIIDGQTVRKNTEHKGMWDIIESRGGRLTGKVAFTGTMKEVRAAIKLGRRAVVGSFETKTPKIVQVSVNDGSALYVDDWLVSEHFTLGESRILEALGFRKWKSILADDDHYKTEPWPKRLQDIVILK